MLSLESPRIILFSDMMSSGQSNGSSEYFDALRSWVELTWMCDFADVAREEQEEVQIGEEK